MQRTKGATFEREVCEFLSRFAGQPVKRALGQARDGGHDILFGDLLIECKRRAALALTPWMKQVDHAVAKYDANAGDYTPHYPALVLRADKQDALFVCRLDDLERVVRSLSRILSTRELLS